MLSALIFPLIPSSHTLPAPQASGLQHTDSGAGGGESREGGAASHREAACSANAGKELFIGYNHWVQSAVGGGFTRS